MHPAVCSAVKKRVKFNVNEEKRIVVAFVEKSNYLIHDVINNIIESVYGREHALHSNDLSNYKLKCPDQDVLFAKAKCSVEDEWNEAEGKRIAFRRLCSLVKMHTDNALVPLIPNLFTLTANLNAFVHKREH